MTGGLDGKVALVTGGASGIGAGIATVAADLPKPGLGVRIDVTDRDSTGRAVGLIERELGTVDVLVNNAGASSVTPFLGISDQDWDQLMAVNLRGVLSAGRRPPKTSATPAPSWPPTRPPTSPARRST